MPKVQKKPKLRTERVASLIQELLAPIIAEYIPEDSGLVTVSRVEISGDMRHAKVWLSILGGSDEKVLQSLQQNIYDVQGDIIRQIPMKIVPRLQFHLDTSPRFAQHISEVIDNLHKDD